MIGLALGLFGLSCAFLGATRVRMPWFQSIWLLCALAALVHFALQPLPFQDVALWAATSTGLCLLDRDKARAGAILFPAGLAGFLIGAAEPYIEFALQDVGIAVSWLATVSAFVVALAAGYALGSVTGVAMAALSTSLSLGLLTASGLGPAIAALAIGANAVLARAAPLSAVVILFLPAATLFGDRI